MLGARRAYELADTEQCLHDAFLDYRNGNRANENCVLRMLIEQYAPSLRAQIYSIVQNEHDVEEVLQDVFMQVLQRCASFSEGRALRPWLHAIAHNRAVDFLRYRRRHNREVQHEECPSDDGAGTLSPQMLIIDTGTQEPVLTLIQGERAAFAREILEQLPDSKYCQIIELVYLEGMKYQEAADALGIPIGTVKSRLHVALKLLRDIAHNAGEP